MTVLDTFQPAPPSVNPMPELWRTSVGDVPDSRIVRDPAPGTATEADLLRLADHDDRLCELIDGTLVEKPLGLDESFVAATIIGVLKTFVRSRRLGKVSAPDATMRMRASGRVRMPDASFISRERIATLPFPRPRITEVAPELAVEVFSASNTAAEMLQKRRELFASGTRLFWMAFPITRTVAIYTEPESPDRVLAVGDIVDGGDVLPGFSVTVAEIFEDLDD